MCFVSLPVRWGGAISFFGGEESDDDDNDNDESTMTITITMTMTMTSNR